MASTPVPVSRFALECLLCLPSQQSSSCVIEEPPLSPGAFGNDVYHRKGTTPLALRISQVWNPNSFSQILMASVEHRSLGVSTP